MKKIISALVLASLISPAFAEPLKIDGKFRKISGQTSFLDLWQKNGPDLKEATYTITKTDDGNEVNIKTGKKSAALVANGRFPVKIGQTYKVRIELKGNAGYCSVGFYLNTAKGEWVNPQEKRFNSIACKEYTVFEGTFTLKPEKKEYTYGNLNIGISSGGADITIKEISVELAEEGK